MRKKVFFGQNDIRFFYYRYKDSSYYSWSLIVATLLVSMVLVLNVIVPLIKSNFSIREEVIALRAKITTLNENINLMNNLDKSVLNSQFQTASKALPTDKDYLSVLSALSEAAVFSGVTLDDFSFINVKSASNQSKTSIILTIVVNGDIAKVKEFLKQVNSRLPIAQVISIDNTLNSTYINLEYFYKPFPKLAYKEDEAITPLSEKDTELLRKLSTWQNGVDFEADGTDEASPSGTVPLF